MDGDFIQRVFGHFLISLLIFISCELKSWQYQYCTRQHAVLRHDKNVFKTMNYVC